MEVRIKKKPNNAYIYESISYKLPSDRLSLFRRSVNRWRVSTPASTIYLPSK
jgi:hypothetical protein